MWYSSWKRRATSSASPLKATHQAVTLEGVQHKMCVAALPPGGQPGGLIINGRTLACKGWHKKRRCVFNSCQRWETHWSVCSEGKKVKTINWC